MQGHATPIVADPDGPARADVAELLETVEALEPSLVVLDVALADGSAYECCRALRERFGSATGARAWAQAVA